MMFLSSFSSLILERMQRSASLDVALSKLIGRWLLGRVGFCFGLGNVIIMADFHEDGKWDSARIELIRLRRRGRYSGGSCLRCLFVIWSGPGAFFGFNLAISVDSWSVVIGRTGGEGGGLLRNWWYVSRIGGGL